MEKINIRQITSEALSAFLLEHGEKVFRVKQIEQWLWQRGVTRFDEMTNLSKSTRELLEAHYYIRTPKLTYIQESQDGTTKLGLTLWDGQLVETVLIPGRDKATACLSSQVGCKLRCHFCATGEMGYHRNLGQDEIFDQVTLVKRMAEEKGMNFSNIVLMGMGEPLLNYEQVMSAIRVITSEEGLAMSPYRVTLSTAGIPEGIRRLADDQVRFNLAISLHAAIPDLREKLMPISQAYPLPMLAEAIKYFVEKTGSRPTFEYLLLKDLNDTPEAAKALALYCRQFPVKINIIEYNPVAGLPYKPSPEKTRDQFIQFLESKNMIVNLRRSKGKDIDAACGQLANKNRKLS